MFWVNSIVKHKDYYKLGNNIKLDVWEYLGERDPFQNMKREQRAQEKYREIDLC